MNNGETPPVDEPLPRETGWRIKVGMLLILHPCENTYTGVLLSLVSNLTSPLCSVSLLSYAVASLTLFGLVGV